MSRPKGARQLTKICPTCKIEKTADNFRMRKVGRLYSYCSPCALIKERESYYRNREKKLFRQKRWKLKARYGITEEQYATLLTEQGGVCKICQEDKPLHIDHSHETGEVRGLLCAQCNHGLGNFRDSIKLLENAIGYLS